MMMIIICRYCNMKFGRLPKPLQRLLPSVRWNKCFCQRSLEWYNSCFWSKKKGSYFLFYKIHWCGEYRAVPSEIIGDKVAMVQEFINVKTDPTLMFVMIVCALFECSQNRYLSLYAGHVVNCSLYVCVSIRYPLQYRCVCGWSQSLGLSDDLQVCRRW